MYITALSPIKGKLFQSEVLEPIMLSVSLVRCRHEALKKAYFVFKSTIKCFKEVVIKTSDRIYYNHFPPQTAVLE